MKNLSTFLVVMLCTIYSVNSNAQTTGTVFRDYNGNGTRENASPNLEPLVAGIIVNAYNSADVLVASYTTTSAAAPNFSIPLTGSVYNGTPGSNTGSVNTGVAVRLEFIIPASGACGLNPNIDYSSGNGSTVGSSVRFITGGATAVNYAIQNPADFKGATTNPLTFTTRFSNGDPNAANPGAVNGLLGFPYNNTGTTAPSRTLASSNLGSIWGLAYSRVADRMFAAAYVKRHWGLKGSTGQIFSITNLASGTMTSTAFFDFDKGIDGIAGNADDIPTRYNGSVGAITYGSAGHYTISGTAPIQTITYNGSTDPISNLPAGLGVIGTNAERILPTNTSSQSNDPAAFGQVGRVGLGDIEISDDGLFLYVVNLYDRKLYRLTLNNATNPTAVTAVTSFSLPTPPLRSTKSALFANTYTGANDNTAFYNGTRGYQRPFGLKFWRGKVYVGAVTSGEGTGAVSTKDNNTGNPEYTDLWAYVWEFDAATAAFSSSPLLQEPQNFNRGINGDGKDETWKPWTNTLQGYVTTGSQPADSRYYYYAQPMFTGIDFDNDGSMILGFRDRFGDQAAYDQPPLTGAGSGFNGGTPNLSLAIDGIATGDILRAYRNPGTCNFVMEANATAGSITTAGAMPGALNGGQGPSNYTTQNGEFYYQDGLEVFNGGAGDANYWHLNNPEGALAMLPGDNNIATTITDPLALFSNGISKMSNVNGTNTSDYQLTGTTSRVELGKASALGDLEFLLPPSPIEIGNRVWNDTNGDGIQNPGETGISGVTLQLVDASGNPVDSDPGTAGVQATFVTTDASGNWYLTSATGTDATGINYGVALLPNTTYKVRLATGAGDDWDPAANGGAGGPRAGGQLVGFSLTKTNSVGNGAVDLSDNDAAMVSSIPEISITLGNYGQNNHNLDIGFKQLASLGNRVWLDMGAGGGTANNGVQDGTEPGVAGVPVMLYRNGADGLPGTNDDVLVGSTITDAYGIYQFDNLQPTDQTNATTIGQTSYNVRVTPPANYSFTTQTNTTDDNNTSGASTTGSDVNPLGVSYSVNLSSGENNPNIDAGLIFRTPTLPNSIGDRVWFDTNGDGNQDAGEPGVSGVTVILYASDGITIVAITTTDANGNYLFNNLPANTNYIVGFSAPGGTIFSPNVGGTTPGNATTNSDADPVTGKTGVVNTGVAGTQQTGIDAGIRNDAKGALGDFVWNDLNKNGIQDAGEPGVPGVKMELYMPGPDGVIGGGDDILVSTDTTDATGYYIFPNLDPGAYFVVATPPAGYTVSPKDVTAGNPAGDVKDNDFGAGAAPYAGKYVSGLYGLPTTIGGLTRDMTVDMGIYNSTANLNSIGDKVWNDVNNNGLQDVGEAGVPNVSVRLLNGSGVAVNNPATGLPYVVITDANGNYKFVDLPDGNYIVEFANIPSGYSFTNQDASGSGAPGSGTDGTNDSDPKTTTGRTGVIDLDAAGTNPVSVNLTNVDAGIVQGIPAGTASLGNRVWYDMNNNGLQDAGELGVANVKVELLDGSGNPVDSDPNTAGVQAYIVFTNALGEYLFTGLAAGDYTVRFSRFPAGYTSSPLNAGNDALDADANFVGTSVTASTTATTGIYTLQTGEDNMTVDMGIVPAAGTNSLGNFVWYDQNNDGKQGAGEPGTQGVMVTLYTNGVDGLPGTADDVYVGVTVTDSLGRYLFAGLPDGNYNVGFTNLPAGYSFTNQNVSGSTAADGSDANTASGRTGTFALDPTSASSTAVNNVDADAGLVTTRAALGNYVWIDSDADGVQDATEAGVPGVTVILYASDGTTVLASTITDANGKYYFGNLTPGDYVVGFSTIPSNLTFTQQNTPGDNQDNTNSDANPVTGKTSVINLIAGETDLTIDAGLKPNIPASVGDYVWNDVDGDGVQDVNEPGVPGIIVTLYNSSNAVVGTAVTDGNGKYLISNIPPGSGYYIIFSNLPPTAEFTTQTSNVTPGDATLGSDASTVVGPNFGKTATFSLSAGQYLPTVDAGIKKIQLLPLVLVSFTAQPQGSTVQLEWKVAEQLNIKGYIVEFSTDGRNFSQIGNVTANSNANARYNAVHQNPVTGINYYRIRITERDGSFYYSDIRRVNFGKGGSIIVYPNPAKDIINITLSSIYVNKPSSISIISVDGRILTTQKTTASNQTETVDVSRFAAGKYILRIVTETEVVNKTIEVIR